MKNRQTYKSTTSKTVFIPLPLELQKPINTCTCLICTHSPDKAMWDTLAFEPGGITYIVHFPELQSQPVQPSQLMKLKVEIINEG